MPASQMGLIACNVTVSHIEGIGTVGSDDTIASAMPSPSASGQRMTSTSCVVLLKRVMMILSLLRTNLWSPSESSRMFPKASTNRPWVKPSQCTTFVVPSFTCVSGK